MAVVHAVPGSGPRALSGTGPSTSSSTGSSIRDLLAPGSRSVGYDLTGSGSRAVVHAGPGSGPSRIPGLSAGTVFGTGRHGRCGARIYRLLDLADVRDDVGV